jgi:hypothetical protein
MPGKDTLFELSIKSRTKPANICFKHYYLLQKLHKRECGDQQPQKKRGESEKPYE